MGRNKDETIRKIQKSNKFYYVTLPIRLVRKLGWREKQKLRVTKQGKKLSVKDWKK